MTLPQRPWLALICAIGLALPVTLQAQALESLSPVPTTHPSRAVLDRRETARIRKGLGTSAPDKPSNNAPLTAEERNASEKFMEANSPKRWEKLKNLRPERKDRILALVRNQMRALDHLKNEDPKIYALRMSRLPIEDEMFSLVWKLDHPDANADDRDALHASLREQVQKFVENSLQEQKLHLDHLQERLAKQQQEFNNAQDNFNKLNADKEKLVDNGTRDVEAGHGGVLRDLAGLPPIKSHDGATTSAATEPSADNGEPPAP